MYINHLSRRLNNKKSGFGWLSLRGLGSLTTGSDSCQIDIAKKSGASKNQFSGNLASRGCIIGVPVAKVIPGVAVQLKDTFCTHATE